MKEKYLSANSIEFTLISIPSFLLLFIRYLINFIKFIRGNFFNAPTIRREYNTFNQLEYKILKENEKKEEKNGIIYNNFICFPL